MSFGHLGNCCVAYGSVVWEVASKPLSLLQTRAPQAGSGLESIGKLAFEVTFIYVFQFAHLSMICFVHFKVSQPLHQKVVICGDIVRYYGGVIMMSEGRT